MDGFDDLLAPSRQALEDNPFASPFARSSSPDPWANPYAAASHSTNDVFGGNSSTGDHSTEDHSTPSVTENIDSTPSPVDPLDSARAALEDDDEKESRGRIRSPGFRESMPSTFDETATIRPTEPEELPTSIHETGIRRTPSPPDAEVKRPSPVSSSPPVHSHPSQLPTSATPLKSESLSPLTSMNNVIESSSAPLTLGGDSLGSWQSEQTPWTNEEPALQFAPQPQTDDDSDDDKPIGQTLKFSEQGRLKQPESTKTARNNTGLQPVFTITVDDPQKVGDPIRSFTMYTVHTRTTSPLFQKSAFSVLRRYSDFLWLYETLSNNNPGVVVPPVPEKNSFGRFDDHFVKQRRYALEKCIQKIANHPVLGSDPDLKLFLESDSFALDIKHRKAELAHERGGLIATIGQTITGPRFHETDEWFDRQKAYLDSLESQLRGLAKSIESVGKQRSELATATGEFAQAVSDLASSDIGKNLAQSLAGLAEVQRKAQDLQNLQSEQDMVTIMATVDEYARLINSVRLAFNSRIRTFHAWKNAESDLVRVRQSHEKNRVQGRLPTDRMGHSLNQIAEAERRSLEAKHEFDNVSKLVKTEVARFEQERIEDFKDSLHAFLEGMIARQKELISSWESYQQMLLKKVGGGAGTGLRVVGNALPT